MYAISFDLKIEDLKKHYNGSYNNAYDEIRKALESLGFMWTEGSLYINKINTNGFVVVYKVIDMLKNIQWFKASVREVIAFKVEDLSDFTDIIKQ